MIFQCDVCEVIWTPYPTHRRVRRATSRICPDCKRDRQPRSRRRKKR